MWLSVLMCVLVGYMLGNLNGAVSMSLLLSKDDIRNHGSGNAGTTNALRVLGKKAGAIVFAGDFLKCFLSIHLVRIVFKNSAPDILPLLSRSVPSRSLAKIIPSKITVHTIRMRYFQKLQAGMLFRL